MSMFNWSCKKATTPLFENPLDIHKITTVEECRDIILIILQHTAAIRDKSGILHVNTQALIEFPSLNKLLVKTP